MEVGPGPGALTRSLLAAGAKKVIAVERDERCVAALEDYLVPASDGRLHIIEGDALSVFPYKEESEPVTIIANLPYNVATPLLLKWLDDLAYIDGFALMFQKEVGDRLVAESGTKSYGRLAVKAQCVCDVSRLFDLPPQAFTPPPKVNSSVIGLVPKEKPLVDIDIKLLEKFTALLFNQRRKTLRAILKGSLKDRDQFEQEAPIDLGKRPEQLSIAEIGALAVLHSKYS
jgi:16S rRNA (adenine1518-N6/adenine1519-N6)-dimethyltransferase